MNKNDLLIPQLIVTVILIELLIYRSLSHTVFGLIILLVALLARGFYFRKDELEEGKARRRRGTIILSLMTVYGIADILVLNNIVNTLSLLILVLFGLYVCLLALK
jgi:hypothetical protein